jgi:hypothetical protein
VKTLGKRGSLGVGELGHSALSSFLSSDGKTTSIKDKLRQEGLIKQSVAETMLY